MNHRPTSRRSVLKSGAALGTLGLVGSLSGCSMPFGGDSGSDGDDGGDGGSGAKSRIGKVPAGAQFVAHVDVDRMLSDEKIQEALGANLSGPTATPVGTVEATGTRIEGMGNLDPESVDEMLVWANADSESGGTIAWASWDRSDVTDALTAKSYEKESYGGKTVYVERPKSDASADEEAGMADESRTYWVAFLNESAYAMGTESAVKAAIDTWTGESDAVGGTVKSGYGAASGGYVRYAFEFPAEMVPESPDDRIDTSVFENVEYGYGSLRGPDGERALEMHFETSTEKAAQQINGLVPLLTGFATEELPESSGDFATAVENLESSRDGKTVTILSDAGVEFALGAVAVLATFALGFGNRTGSTAPQAIFDYEYHEDGEELTVTHAGGDNIEASELFLRGTGVRTQSWSELDDETDDDSVSAGDSVTLTGVPSDYEMSVIWRSAAGDDSATLYRDEGPDA